MKKIINFIASLFSRWIPVTKKMPPIETLVIGYFPDGDENGAKIALAMSYDGKRLMSSPSSSVSHHFLATHWQPLPKPLMKNDKET